MHRKPLRPTGRNVTVRLPPDVDRRIIAAAEQGERTVSDEVRLRLQHSLDTCPRLVLRPAPAE